MRILFFCGHPDIQVADRSGAGTHIRGVADGFESLGHSVEFLFAAQRSKDVERTDRARSARGEQLSAILRRYFPFVWETLRDTRVLRAQRASLNRLRDRLSAGEIDLVYERASYLQGGSTSLSASVGVPHIVELNSPLVEERRALSGNSLFSSAARRAERALLQNATRIVVVSTPLQAWLKATHSDLPAVIVAPNATQLKFEATNSSPNSDRLRVGFIGSMLGWHRLDLLISALATARIQELDIELVLVGTGPALQPALTQAEDLGVADAVLSTGHVPQQVAQQLLLTLDVGVLAANASYGSPTKLLEYAAAGLAIVAPDEAGTRDLFTHGKNAILVAPEVEPLVDALQLLLGSAGIRRQLGVAAREIAAEWTWTDVAHRTLAGIESPKR